MERPISATCTIAAPFPLARAVLGEDPGAVLCDSCTEEERGGGRHPVTLAVDLGGGTSVHQEVALQLGAVQSLDAVLTVPVSWEATGHNRLLPTLHGTLDVSRDAAGTRLRLQGAYSLPLGVVGRLGDAVAGRRLARLSVAAFVERLGARLDEAVRGSIETEPAAPTVIILDVAPEAAPHAAPSDDLLTSEHYIG